jgi:RNA polymerase sigma factor (sigma-70 family)
MLHPYDTSIDESSPNRGELFLQRYNRLLDWAMKLTNQRRAAAEDLVHDAFVQFMLCRLEGINNLDGYLYGMLRKMRISQLRRSAQQINKMYHIRIADYDSAEGGLVAVLRAESHAVDSRIQIQDELQQICQYVCERKETSKSASILILRFFLGYFPREISKIIRCQDRAVRDLLMTARREVKLYLNSPEQLKFFNGNIGSGKNSVDGQKTGDGFKWNSTDNLLQELRTTIFRSRQHECLSPEQIQKFYDDETPSNALDCATLAHVVSCIGCLEHINRILQLPPLLDRFPTDMLGPDSKRNGSDDGDGSATGSVSGSSAKSSSAGSASHSRAISQQRLMQAFEHRPQELSVSVNGFIIGSLKISGETNELILNRNGDEPVEFIEVFSEQGIRLLFFEPGSPACDGRQDYCIELSNGRKLQVEFNPGVPWSSFQISYCDPELSEAEEPARLKLVESVSHQPAAAAVHSEPHQLPAEPDLSLPGEAGTRPHPSEIGLVFGKFNEFWQALASSVQLFFSARLWSNPGRVTAFVASLIAVALVIHGQLAPSINAASILARANSTEETINSNPGVIQHRVMDFEERRPADGRVISRWRIEDYRSGARGVKVRRLYDENHRLVAGEWRKADGTRTLYGREESPKASTRFSAQTLNLDDIWQLDLSAKEFTALIKNPDTATIEETARSYVIKYQLPVPGPARAMAELISAVITLSKHDLYPLGQTLLIRQADETREFRFSEASYEQLPVIRVSPDKFEPEPELLGDREAKGILSNAITTAPNPKPEPSPAALATAELEVEVIRLLDQVNAFSREQLSVTRTSKGLLQVEGIIDTDERKQELVRSLSTVQNHPAIRIRIETSAEAVKRLAGQQSNTTVNLTGTNEVRFTNKFPPAYPELRRYFSERGAANERTDAIDKYTDTMLRRSRRTLQHARAMKQIAARFTSEQLKTLDEKALAQWHTMIREHARSFQSEVAVMRRELEPIFLPSNFVNETQTEAEFTSDIELVYAVGRLFDIWAGVDEDVRNAFSISTADPIIIEIKLPQFWRSLKSAESLSALVKNSFPTSHR